MNPGEDLEIDFSHVLRNAILTDIQMDAIIQDILRDEVDNNTSDNQENIALEDPKNNNRRDTEKDSISALHNSHPQTGGCETDIQSFAKYDNSKDFTDIFLCVHCNFQFSVREALQMHASAVHGVRPDFKNPSVQRLAFDAYSVMRYFSETDHRQLRHVGATQEQHVKNIFRSLYSTWFQEVLLGLQIFTHVAIKFFLHCKIRPNNDTATASQIEFVLESGASTIFCKSQVDQLLLKICLEFEKQAGSYFENHSGFYLLNVDVLKIFIMRHTHTYDAEYTPLPYVFQKRRELFINVDNSLESFKSETLTSNQEKLRSIEDLNSSFLFSVAAGIRKSKYCPDSMKTYRSIIKKFKLDGITMPMTINQLPRFERQNPNLEICVFGFKDTGINDLTHPDLFPKNNPGDNVRSRSRKSVARCAARDQVISQYSFPLYASTNTPKGTKRCEVKNQQRAPRATRALADATPHKIDLFLILSDKPNHSLSSENCMKTSEHYVLCKDLESIFRCSNRCKSYLCRHCLKRFQKSSTLRNHIYTAHLNRTTKELSMGSTRGGGAQFSLGATNKAK